MNGATNHVAENAYLWECTIVVTRFFKVVLAIFNAARDTKIVWTLEKNEDAIRFYESHGFMLNGKRPLEEGTPEYIVMLER